MNSKAVCGVCSGKGFIIDVFDEEYGMANTAYICMCCKGKGVVNVGVQTCVKCKTYFHGEEWEKYCDTCLKDYLSILLADYE